MPAHEGMVHGYGQVRAKRNPEPCTMNPKDVLGGRGDNYGLYRTFFL